MRFGREAVNRPVVSVAKTTTGRAGVGLNGNVRPTPVVRSLGLVGNLSGRPVRLADECFAGFVRLHAECVGQVEDRAAKLLLLSVELGLSPVLADVAVVVLNRLHEPFTSDRQAVDQGADCEERQRKQGENARQHQFHRRMAADAPSV